MSYDIVPYRKITPQDIGRDISRHATLERGVSFARTTGRGQTFRRRRRDAFVGAGTMHESLGVIDGFAPIHVQSQFPADWLRGVLQKETVFKAVNLPKTPIRANSFQLSAN
ncbi:hypothetical protein AB4120_21715 [Cupriavidus sp. 2KB_3]|uniref:hypothetical protein n=1 Tax=Cupriavidus TaxID=106589 RepID=UPI0011EFB174|nr:hypothetical protein [Cupriavidus campinensis]